MVCRVFHAVLVAKLVLATLENWFEMLGKHFKSICQARVGDPGKLIWNAFPTFLLISYLIFTFGLFSQDSFSRGTFYHKVGPTNRQECNKCVSFCFFPIFRRKSSFVPRGRLTCSWGLVSEPRFSKLEFVSVFSVGILHRKREQFGTTLSFLCCLWLSGHIYCEFMEKGYLKAM